MRFWPIILFIVGCIILYYVIVAESDWLQEFLDTFTDDKDK